MHTHFQLDLSMYHDDYLKVHHPGGEFECFQKGTSGVAFRAIPILFGLFIFILFFSTTAEITYKINSVRDDQLIIDFSVTNSISDENCYYFAYPAFKTADSYLTITVSSTEQTYDVGYKKLTVGQSGSCQLQWCSFTLPEPVKRHHVQGKITINYNASALRSIKSNDISIKNGIIRIDFPQQPQGNLAKIISHPFSVGLRIEISEDGIYKISSEQLRSLGVPVETISSRTYRVFNKNKEIPLYISDPLKSKLSSDDYILFYGEKLRNSSGGFEQFSNTNIYWLTWNNSIGARVTEISGESGKNTTDYNSSGIKKATAFFDTIHLEVDTDIRYLGNIEDEPPEEVTDPPNPDTTIDNWYWGFVGEKELTTYKITIPAPASTGFARLQVSFTGLSSLDDVDNDHQIRILLNNNPASSKNIVTWDGQRSIVFTSDTFHVNNLNAGDNTISFLCPSRGFPDRSALNWIKIEYPRNYQSVNNSITFKNYPDGEGKRVAYTLSGFDNDQIELWDIKQNRFFTSFSIARGTGNSRNLYTLSFQDSINYSTTYFAQSKHLRRTPSFMILDTIKSDWEKLANYQYIVIGPDSFKTELDPLIKLHSSRGLKAAFIDIDDIYNYFSAGIRDPESIRTFLRYLFSISTKAFPKYLLLGGDTSHDLDKKNRNLNIVPTHLSRIPGWGPAADDGYFGTVWGDDNFPDLCVGRFPAQNKAQMQTMVQKTVKYIQEPQRGFWRDNMLLLGGGEKAFTQFNDQLISEVVGLKMNTTRLEADSGSYFYKDGFSAPKIIADKINSGVYVVNFNGHGGGNIWSDNNFFGYRDLTRLYNGQWGKGGRLPFVFSFTCLTGFFESVHYRSLGEEFLRTNENGCIGFYGASAYTSMKGNLLMNKLMIETALRGEALTIGEIIDFCEMSMLVRYSSEYIHLIRQYNLLGDPALPWIITPDTLSITLTNASLKDGDSIKMQCTTKPVKNGNIKVTISAGNDQWYQSIDTINNGKYSLSYPVKANINSTAGVVRVYAWNDSSEVRGWVNFSKDTILISDVKLTPDNPFFGDSVLVSCNLSLDSSLLPADIYCRYALGTASREDLQFSGVRMIPDGKNRWVTSQKLPLTYNSNITHRLLLYFRVLTPSKSKESELFSFSVQGRPDLAFIDDSIGITWHGDSLNIRTQVINLGNQSSPPFDLHLFWNFDGAITDTICIIRSSDSLLPGKIRSFSYSLPDTQGNLSFSGWLNYHNRFLEINTFNNKVYGFSTVKFKTLSTQGDTLTIENCNTVSIAPANKLSQKKRVFVISKPITSKTPLKTSSEWLSHTCSNPVQHYSFSRPSLGSKDSLVWIFKPDSNISTNTSNGKLSIMVYDTTIENWKSAGGTLTKNDIRLTTAQQGPFALAKLKDMQSPDIMITVAGRLMSFTDYAARNKPFNIMISDPSGIDPQSVKLMLNSKMLDTSNYSQVSNTEISNNFAITAYLPQKQKIDTLHITAMDLAGNSSVKVITYQPGEELSIKFLSCHPNPFTAQKMPNGAIRNVRFAFLLTDVADEITLTIFTVSGRPIRSWSLNSLIGYQEIVWDGRDKDGARIANGTYYAKLVAKNKQKKVKKIIRIAKLEGY